MGERLGKCKLNNRGSKMIITRYNGCLDVDIYFPEYDWMAKGVSYGSFEKGGQRCPFEPTLQGRGYLGEGIHETSINGKPTIKYIKWHSMFTRCYDENSRKHNITYIDSEVEKDWWNFQTFGDWHDDNYYTIDGEVMCLDKDILYKYNKIYSPNTCVYVPKKINNLFTKSNKARGIYPIGVTAHRVKINSKTITHERPNRFDATMSYLKNGKKVKMRLGTYDTIEEAFYVYKEAKEFEIKKIANEYKSKIPSVLYDALMNYEVDIND